MNELIDLVACPLCGRRPVETLDAGDWYRYRCRREDFGGTHCIEGTASTDKSDAALWWNFYAGDVVPTMRESGGVRS